MLPWRWRQRVDAYIGLAADERALVGFNGPRNYNT